MPPCLQYGALDSPSSSYFTLHDLWCAGQLRRPDWLPCDRCKAQHACFHCRRTRPCRRWPPPVVPPGARRLTARPPRPLQAKLRGVERVRLRGACAHQRGRQVAGGARATRVLAGWPCACVAARNDYGRMAGECAANAALSPNQTAAAWPRHAAAGHPVLHPAPCWHAAVRRRLHQVRGRTRARPAPGRCNGPPLPAPSPAPSRPPLPCVVSFPTQADTHQHQQRRCEQLLQRGRG